MDRADVGGNTPLHVAAQQGAFSFANLHVSFVFVFSIHESLARIFIRFPGLGQEVTLLLRLGANKHAKTKSGMLPEQVAISKGHEHLVNLFR